MYDKFGEFDSYKEINEAAAGQKAQGDTQAILDIAKENGIPGDDAKDYIDGVIDQLALPLTAAYGKLDVEAEDLKLPKNSIFDDWIGYIRIVCEEEIVDGKEDFCLAVRRKDKSLVGCLGALLEESWKGKWSVPQSITKAAGVSDRVSMGIPDMATAKKIIREYYGGK